MLDVGGYSGGRRTKWLKKKSQAKHWHCPLCGASLQLERNLSLMFHAEETGVVTNLGCLGMHLRVPHVLRICSPHQHTHTEWVLFLNYNGSFFYELLPPISSYLLPGKPKNTGVGSLSLLQRIFPTQKSNQGLQPCRQILYQLNYQGSPTFSQPPSSHWHISVQRNVTLLPEYFCQSSQSTSTTGSNSTFDFCDPEF